MESDYKHLSARVLKDVSEDVEDIFKELVDLRSSINDSGYYDNSVTAKEKDLECKVARLLLYLDSMRALHRDLETRVIDESGRL